MNPKALVRAVLGLAVVLLATNDASAGDNDCEQSGLAGLWTFHVTPQPSPDVEIVPPPFTALFVFEAGGTLNETDTGFHPTAAVPLFPELGPLSSSDGLGAWESDGRNRYHGQFIKNLFDASGAAVGFVITRFEITLRSRTRLEARTVSDFVLGNDLNAEPFFSGGVTLGTATRLGAD